MHSVLAISFSHLLVSIFSFKKSISLPFRMILLCKILFVLHQGYQKLGDAVIATRRQKETHWCYQRVCLEYIFTFCVTNIFSALKFRHNTMVLIFPQLPTLVQAVIRSVHRSLALLAGQWTSNAALKCLVNLNVGLPEDKPENI